MPLDYVALNQRVADALVSANPANGLATIAQEIRYPRGDDFDHNAAELALSLLRRTPPDTAGAAYWLRTHFINQPAGRPRAPPVVVASPAAGEPSTGGRRRRKTRKHRKIHRGGGVDRATRLREMKIQYESVRDLKKTGVVDLRQKIEEIAAALKLLGGGEEVFGKNLLTTLNAPVEYGDPLENAKSMLEGFFRNVPEVPVTTRRSTDGGTRKKRHHTRRRR